MSSRRPSHLPTDGPHAPWREKALRRRLRTDTNIPGSGRSDLVFEGSLIVPLSSNDGRSSTPMLWSRYAAGRGGVRESSTQPLGDDEGERRGRSPARRTDCEERVPRRVHRPAHPQRPLSERRVRRPLPPAPAPLRLQVLLRRVLRDRLQLRPLPDAPRPHDPVQAAAEDTPRPEEQRRHRPRVALRRAHALGRVEVPHLSWGWVGSG